MRKKRRRNFNKINIKSYYLFLILFVLGILVGTILANSISDYQNLALAEYLNKSISDITTSSFSNTELLLQNIYGNLKFLLIISILGLIQFGYIGILAFAFTKGLVFGFTEAFFTISYGVRGTLFCFTSYLFHSIIILFVTFIIFKSIVEKDSKYIKQRQDKMEYFILVIISIVLIILASVIETYVSAYISDQLIFLLK